MANNSRKVAVVGGGIAGLCAAVYAQRSGYQVDVFEMHDSAGGLATSWRRGDYTFETCLHWLLGSNPSGLMHSRWQEVFDISKVTFIDAVECARMTDEHGDSLVIYRDVDRMEAELLRQSPQDGSEIRRLAAAIRSFMKFPMPFMEEPWPRNWLTLLRTVPYLPALRRWANLTAEEYSLQFQHPLLRAFIRGDMPEMCVIPLILSLAWMSSRDAGYAIGGSQAIIRPIVDRLRNLGGRIRLATKVEKILVERDTAIGVKLAGGETIAADWVISAADGHATIYELLSGEYVDKTIDEIYSNLKPFPSYLQVSLGVARDLSAQSQFMRRVLDTPLRLDPETEIGQISIRFFHFDRSFAPPGKTPVTCVLPTRNIGFWTALQESDPARYHAEKQRVAEAVISILEKAIPGLRNSIEVVDVSTPASVIHYTGNWKGSMEGWLPTPNSGFKQLPASLPGLQRFLMAGQWVMPGGGLPTGLLTARSAVQHLCKLDGTPFLAHGVPSQVRKAAAS